MVKVIEITPGLQESFPDTRFHDSRGQAPFYTHHSWVTGTAAVPYIQTGKFSNSLMHNEPGPPSDESVTLAFTGDFPGSPWLRLCVPNAGHMGWIPAWGAEIPHAKQYIQRTQENKPTKTYIHKSAQQVKAFRKQHSKWLLHVQSNVEANVEKQSFPNLSVKFLFKDN